ncbi:hypothetical protein [Phytohabitans houttuyneae]|uniref:Actin-binding WH2 domain-containing protein n=1 Tax=Phytohabitans houttuyneae TaxID=1076126 RepID=A0A6V8K6J3_9ACTN|nr:hypothetical protein [Phytohabitans houttuyneae]GFJ79140.1 hypothetical protein Phou_033200 [Phytohabitans houttuyneae]
MSANGSGLLVIERILRDRQSIWQQIVDERELGQLTTHMLASSAIALALYGAVLGAFHSFLMALTSAAKLPLLFLVTLAICLPTLYLFNLVFGARLSVRQALAMVMVAITVTAMLAVAFAPISLFFLITAPDYGFFKLLNVAILTLSAIVGLRFLTSGMQVLNEHGLLAPAVQPAAAPAVPAAVPAQPAPAEAVPVTPISAVPATAVPAAAPAAVNGGAASTVVSAPLPPPPPLPVAAGWDPGARGGYPPHRPPPAAPASSRRPAPGEHDAAVHLDPAVRLRGHPARVDAAAVLRQSWAGVRAVPQHRGQLLRRDPADDRRPVLTVCPSARLAVRRALDPRRHPQASPPRKPARATW